MIDEDWTSIALRLGLATVIGLILGFEREWRGHDAGLRTHALVALSAAIIMLSALMISDDLVRHGSPSDPLRVVQGLAQAIGFIAGGLIFVRSGDVRTMTTAASLWIAAAAGIAAGAGQIALVLIGTGMAIVVLTVLSLIKRLMPEQQDAPTEDDELVLPNRRGAISKDKDRTGPS